MELSRWEPCLIVYRAAGPLRVTATRRDGKWAFAWGRGRDCWGPALDSEVAHRIRQVAR
ncbi:hypothetical protein ACFQ08_07250 [Streptosporangium algeriense]|uniref:Uncharacterized protein n=1 Tax=Streptosporangium algeriense TaxID=1682748 RepID=A0ABW3DNY5_9ACTN